MRRCDSSDTFLRKFEEAVYTAKCIGLEGDIELV
jgi:hypothetical protein